MSHGSSLELVLCSGAGSASGEGARIQLCSPGVGWFSGALAAGSLLSPGQAAGVLTTLAVGTRLLVPEEARGIVLGSPPRRLREPVQYGQVLYELGPLAGLHENAPGAGPGAESHDGELIFRSPQAGRFYHRSAPGEPALCAAGRELEQGTPIGLIEVMKTFTQVFYRPERGLPARAKIVRVLVPDGADVEEGAPLLVVSAP